MRIALCAIAVLITDPGQARSSQSFEEPHPPRAITLTDTSDYDTYEPTDLSVHRLKRRKPSHHHKRPRKDGRRWRGYERSYQDQLRFEEQLLLKQTVRQAQELKDYLPNNAIPGCYLDDLMYSYPRRSDVEKLIVTAMKNAGTKTRHACWHYVKKDLYEAGMVPPGSLNTLSAWRAITDLPAHGFVNLLDNPEYAYLKTYPDEVPVGAVVVYAGDSLHPDGDVQIRVPGGWASDYHTPNAMIHQYNGRHYHVIGVMLKKPVEGFP